MKIGQYRTLKIALKHVPRNHGIYICMYITTQHVIATVCHQVSLQIITYRLLALCDQIHITFEPYESRQMKRFRTIWH